MAKDDVPSAAIEGDAASTPSGGALDEKRVLDKGLDGAKTHTSGLASPAKEDSHSDSDGLPNYANADGTFDDNVVIVSGADAASHLLPLRDDFDPSLTLRSVVLASLLAAFQAAMTQIYNFKPTIATISGTFVVLIAYFLGKAWAAVLPRGDLQLAKWRERHPDDPDAKPPLRIRIMNVINPGPWRLKEHAVCAITATSASNASASSMVFAAQNLFYDLPLSAATVVLSTISIGLFGYGLCGILRPIAVWHVESVYWSTLPMVKTLQGLHWQDVKSSRPLRVFWYSFLFMVAYEFFPAYIWPWLNSVSIPCLAAMHTTGGRAAVLTNLFGGAQNNEGLGLFSITLDWQYITSFNTSLPLTLQAHMAIGLFVCYIVMLAIYYGNGWKSRGLPFMSTSLRNEDGSAYPVSKVFSAGILDESALQKFGIPRLAGSFAYALFIANAAIGALAAHCVFFWGGDTVRAFKDVRNKKYSDPHHAHMAKHYHEVPWTWYVLVLVVSFVLGIIVVTKENITLPVWAYIVSLLVGVFFAPFSTLLYARYGNGIATNNLSKMIAGLAIPGRPVGNMYFAAWSHNVISNAVNLSNDLKIGEYLKIPPRTMFITQIYGTILGAFVNYGVMVAIVTGNRDLLVEGNGDSAWSGATIQSYNTNAASWALAKYLYQAGTLYQLVPIGLAIGAGAVALHWLFARFVPSIRGFQLSTINLPQFIQFAGYIPYNQSQTCVIFSQLIAGFFCQFYLRNYKPRFFKNYMYLVTGAFDGAALFVLFILSFAVFGAGGRTVPFPSWWGNNVNGNYDLCPVSE
ncbi:peptide transporter [Niveomyces insectorum RCEF 264]|uniref:Peptide transporter n=1 Tax=Niveomyces insectorum RCEF 264 TaxID=1081102 RepID=A0A167P4V0_9HYPO|nr:peptide transporter [Niveomyces insectorum RCEF 264]